MDTFQNNNNIYLENQYTNDLIKKQNKSKKMKDKNKYKDKYVKIPKNNMTKK
jgi:hypothetical protein